MVGQDHTFNYSVCLHCNLIVWSYLCSHNRKAEIAFLTGHVGLLDGSWWNMWPQYDYFKEDQYGDDAELKGIC